MIWATFSGTHSLVFCSFLLLRAASALHSETTQLYSVEAERPMAAPAPVPAPARKPSTGKSVNPIAALADPERAKVSADALKRFASLDRDGNGILTREEFREGLGPMGLDEGLVDIIFNTFDSDHNGEINEQEFTTAMAVMLHPANVDEQVEMAFKA